MRLWKKSQGVSPSTSPTSCYSHSVQKNNSGSDNGTNFVGNKRCGQEDTGNRDGGEYIKREVNMRGVHQEKGEHLEPYQPWYFSSVVKYVT
jgi:hypothetical protein